MRYLHKYLIKLNRTYHGHTIEIESRSAKIIKLNRANQGHTIEVSAKILNQIE